MTDSSLERFYQLLPTLYRQRDFEHAEQLRALMAVLESEFRLLEADIEAMYDNWFIQTCDSWVIPYIADLAGIRGLSQQKHIFSTQRRQVADTLGYRRRKGTLSALEHVLKDVTGWYFYAVEFFQHVAVTQQIERAPARARGTVDLRGSMALANLNGPFDQLPHTADVRRLPRRPARDAEQHSERQNRYNLANLGLFVWRLRSYTMRDSFACAAPNRAAEPEGQPPAREEQRYGRYTFHPLGRDMQLFNQPQVITELSQRIDSAYVPMPLSREAFAADLADFAGRYGGRPAAEQAPNSLYYGPDRGLNIVDLRGSDGKAHQITPLGLVGMDLSDWDNSELVTIFESYWRAAKYAAIDVELGRLVMFPPAAPSAPAEASGDRPGSIGWSAANDDLCVTYTYGFGSEIGGGSYHRAFASPAPESAPWVEVVAKGTSVDTLQEALRRWEQECAKPGAVQGIIRILDNGVYDIPDPVALPPGASLTIIADNGVRPTIGPARTIVVACTQLRLDNRRARRLQLNGLLIDGGIELRASDDGQAARASGPAGRIDVTLEHCTLMPLGVKLSMGDQAARATRISISQSIVGPLYITGSADVALLDTIVDAGKGLIADNEQAYAIAADAAGAPGAPLSVQNTTIFGKVHVAELTAANTIFTAAVTVDRVGAAGPVSYCYVPDGSQTPAREHCQPAQGSAIRPAFTSTRYGDPAYAQLSQRCPRRIRRGASDDSEMGAFHNLYRSQAEDNIQDALDEYLPFELHAATIYVT